MSELLVEQDDRGVATITLHRPQARNALSPGLMRDIETTLDELRRHDQVRVLVVAGSGEVFCAGADLAWMRAGRGRDAAEHTRDSARLARLFRAVDEFPTPVVGRMNGDAIAGGTGLLCACDIVVAVDGARMGFTEVRLGIAPATISRIVLPKIGPSAARRWFLTGELFDAGEAARMGLVHQVVDRPDLDEAVARVVDALLAGAPKAQRRTKDLIRHVQHDPAWTEDDAIGLLSELRVGDEGQEGIEAFFDRRAPAWVPARPRAGR